MEFRILGPLEVVHEGRELQIPGEKQRALLAALLLEANRVISTDRLIDDLWDEEPPETGAKALQVRVSQLRRAFEAEGVEEPVVTTRAPGYVIELGGHTLDLDEFEDLVRSGEEALDHDDAGKAAELLRSAVASWRGPPLAEFDLQFARMAAGRLDELRVAAIEKRIEAELTLGQHGGLVGELEELIGEYPFRERLRGEFMLALYRSGRQAEALDAYQSARRLLSDELGIEPSHHLQELERAILQQDPSLDVKAPTPSPSAPSEPPTWDPSPPERSILVVPADLENLAPLLTLAEPLTKRPRREIIVTALVDSFDQLEAVTNLLEDHAAGLSGRGVSARTAAFTSDEAGNDLVRLASEQDVDLLLTDAPPELVSEGTPTSDLHTVLEQAPCDVASLVIGKQDFDLPANRPIIVPFGGAQHEWSAVEIGAWIAAAKGSTLRLLGSAGKPEKGKRDASRLLAGVSLVVQRASGVSTKPLLVPPGEHGVLEATADAGLLIIGLSDRWSSEGLGTVRMALAREARPPTLIVRRGVRPGGLAPLENLTRYTWSLADAGG